MNCYHYTFNSTKVLKVVILLDPFAFVEARELARAILKTESLNPKLSGLLLINGQTKKQYGPLDKIARHTWVIAYRIPLTASGCILR